MNQLSDETILYRAIKTKGWIDPDEGSIDANAFKLRVDEEYLSASLKQEHSYRGLKKCYGVIAVRVSTLRRLGLNSVIDDKDPDYVKIYNLPSNEDEQLAIDIGISIAEEAKIVSNWLDHPLRQ